MAAFVELDLLRRLYIEVDDPAVKGVPAEPSLSTASTMFMSDGSLNSNGTPLVGHEAIRKWGEDHDEFVCTADRWKFTSRVFEMHFSESGAA